jgi:hypothetical protein
MLEMLSSLASPPSFMVDLWSNYDSDLHCEDLFERLIAFLTRVRLLACHGLLLFNWHVVGCIYLSYSRRGGSGATIFSAVMSRSFIGICQSYDYSRWRGE